MCQTETNSKMANLNPAIWIIKLNANGPNAPINNPQVIKRGRGETTSAAQSAGDLTEVLGLRAGRKLESLGIFHTVANLLGFLSPALD